MRYFILAFTFAMGLAGQPQQVQPQITLLANNQVLIEVGQFGKTYDRAWFLRRDILDDQLIRDWARITWQRANYAGVSAAEFLEAVNGGTGVNRRGVGGPDRNHFVQGMTEANGVVTIAYGPQDGVTTFTVQMIRREFNRPTEDPADLIARSIRVFLRLQGINVLNAAALDAVRNQSFWY